MRTRTFCPICSTLLVEVEVAFMYTPEQPKLKNNDKKEVDEIPRMDYNDSVAVGSGQVCAGRVVCWLAI